LKNNYKNSFSTSPKRLVFVFGGWYNAFMKKIIIIGCSGAGKSTLSKKLSEILDLEIINLDRYYWKPNWIKPSKSEWIEIVKKLVKKESWIMEGNYSETFHLRMPEADTIILLDFPRSSCFFRALKRKILENRVDEIPGCREKIKFELVRWILWRYPRVNRKNVLKTLEEFKSQKSIIILKSNKEIEKFLSEIRK
jgi:adenylate kinase family enzyme